MQSENTISLFLLYLIISGNYLGDLFGCRLQEAFTELILVKHLLAFLTLYFFVTLTGTKTQNPLNTMITSFGIYLIFILSRKIFLGYTLIILMLMLIIKMIDEYIQFYYTEDNKEESKKETKINKNKLINIQNVLTYMVYIIIFIGFVRNTHYKYKELGKKFDWIKYLIGENRSKSCQSLLDKHTFKDVIWF